MLRRLAPALLGLALVPTARGDEPPAEVRAALGRISADSLRGHVDFLASDLLEGRGTPSRGLDIAALYVAAQFRRAGLEPIGDDGYFQTAPWRHAEPESFELTFAVAGKTYTIDADHAAGRPTAALDLPATAVIKVDADAADNLTREQVGGKVVLTRFPNPTGLPRERRVELLRALRAFERRLADLEPALVVEVRADDGPGAGLRRDLVGGPTGARRGGALPRYTLHSAALAEAVADLPAGPTGATVAARIGAPVEKTMQVRNVVGLLRGSDPELKGTYVLLSAHYDHLGLGTPNADGDRIYNGANDDASGTASVVEVASALATLPDRPRRSLVFVAFYGEEHGLIGSQYYAAHPVVPLDRTVAAVNLEQLGRTDDSEGPRVGAANVTGFDYSDVPAALVAAGASTGVEVVKHPLNSDLYFGASDNAALARAGVPAHTVSVAYAFPDYHGADDEPERLDYANMTKIDRMVALALLRLADSHAAPRWDESNPKVKPFLKGGR